MRTLALLLALLLIAGCASSDSDLIENEGFDCQDQGNLVSVQFVRFHRPDAPVPGSRVTQQMTSFQVEVGLVISNNSNEDLEVASVTVSQIGFDEQDPIRLDPATRKVNATVKEGNDEVVELTMQGRVDPVIARRGGVQRDFRLRVSVAMATGETYRCVFLVPRTW